MHDNLIMFKTKKAPMKGGSEEVWNDVKSQIYALFLSKGFSQYLADEFLIKFQPVFLSLIPPEIPLYSGTDEEAIRTAEEASLLINDYVLQIIGKTCYRELMHFLKSEVGLRKQDE